MNRELSKLNQSKCKFCNRLDNSKSECRIKRESAVVEVKNKRSIEEELVGTNIKENL